MKNKGVVAFAFGVPCTLESNRLIGEVASRKAEALNAVVFTQRDVCVTEGIKVEYVEELSGPPPTLRIARAAVRWAHKNQIGEMWLSAAAPHLWRSLRDLEEAAREEDIHVTIRVCEELIQLPEHVWFCSESGQERTRSYEEWNKREKILRYMPFWLYKLVAS